MPRLYRPHVPLEVKARVLIRRRGYLFPDQELIGARLEGLAAFVERQKRILAALLHCTVEDLRLDHDPALGVRARKGEGKNTVYDPPANSPDHLIYREKHAHHIKTNVRGEHGQHPDRVLIKRERKRTAARKPCLRCFARYGVPPSRLCLRCQKVAQHFISSANKSKVKMKSRPLQSASRWPSGRKIENRRKP